MNTLTIEQPDIVAFTMAIQQAILEGYRLSEVSDYAPQNIGFVYVTTMFKEETQNMPIGNLTLGVSVNVEQAVEQLKELEEKVGDMLERDEKFQIEAEKIVAQAMTVEPAIVAPKQTQRRNTRGGKQ